MDPIQWWLNFIYTSPRNKNNFFFFVSISQAICIRKKNKNIIELGCGQLILYKLTNGGSYPVVIYLGSAAQEAEY